MSTRSRIGIVLPNKKVESIYCHFDGYPSYVGAILNNYYKDEEKIKELIALGDISCLGQTLEYGDTKDYNRWRNEETKSRIDENIATYKKTFGECWEEYLYLFKSGEWFVYDGCKYEAFTPLFELEECKKFIN